jgi:hypothetical protein
VSASGRIQAPSPQLVPLHDNLGAGAQVSDMPRPSPASAAAGETADKHPEDTLHAELIQLAELCAQGQFEQALQYIESSQALVDALRVTERQSIEALLGACAACAREAQYHSEALERAVEREQALAQHLLDCSKRLLDAEVRPRHRPGVAEAPATPHDPPQRGLIDP